MSRVALVCLAIVSVSTLTADTSSERSRNQQLHAHHYYLVARAICSYNEVSVQGSSNLPPGAMIGVAVAEFKGDAWRYLSSQEYAKVNSNGSFTAQVKSTADRFHGSLLAIVEFRPFLAMQPDAVVRTVGKEGHGLGDVLENPQVSVVSGDNRLLQSITRASCRP